ncbi:hypothetical protein [Almyronema epifaneia]|uniref:Uncharacterized protein n=1 Tax=Almyronema epifaneia S1 TaxID=2991925 RepID=A0ABW6IJ90_9CYAN
MFLAYTASPIPSGGANSPLWLTPPAAPGDREPLRHLLLGSAARVQQTIHLLHVLNYTEQFRWSRQIVVPESGLLLTPAQGEVMSYLIR